MHVRLAITRADPSDLYPGDAQDASSWAALRDAAPAPVSTPAIFRVVASNSPFPLPSSILPSPFAAHVIVRGLHLQLAASGSELHHLGLINLTELERNVRRSLGRIGRGLNAFSPTFGSETFDPSFCGVEVSYHLAHLASYLNLKELDLVAGRGTTAASLSARSKVSLFSRLRG